MHVLVVKSSSLGDIIHTLPALTDARRYLPDIRFDWVVEENFAQIPSWHPAVDRIIPIALRRWRTQLHRLRSYREWAQFTRVLRGRRYDTIIDAQGLIKSAFFITRLAHGTKQGLDRASLRESLACCCYDTCHPVSPQQHAVERARQLFALSLGYTKPAERGCYALLDYFSRDDTASQQPPYLMLLHATSRANKLWPEIYWRQLMKLIAPTGLQIKLPWCAPHEYQAALRLAQGLPHVMVLPKCSLQQLGQLIINASGAVSVDTGLSHLAAALGCPNITLFGPTDPNLVGGYGERQQIYWAEKSRQMSDINPEKVFDQLKAILYTAHLKAPVHLQAK